MGEIRQCTLSSNECILAEVDAAINSLRVDSEDGWTGFMGLFVSRSQHNNVTCLIACTCAKQAYMSKH